MKTMKTMKLYIVISFLACFAGINELNAQGLSLTFNLTETDTLANMIANSKKYEITSLTLSGYINEVNTQYILDLNLKGKLKKLDLEKCTDISSKGITITRTFKDVQSCNVWLSSCGLTLPIESIGKTTPANNSSARIYDYYKGYTVQSDMPITISIKDISEKGKNERVFSFTGYDWWEDFHSKLSKYKVYSTNLSIEFKNYNESLPKIVFTASSFDKFISPQILETIGGDDCSFRVASCNEYVLGDKIKVIGQNAFSGSYIENIKCNSIIDSIKANAFVNSTGNCDISFLKDVKFIGENAFKNSSIFQNVDNVFSLNVSKIDKNAFANAKIPKHISITNIQELGDSAFLSTPLESIVLSDKLEKINNGTFAYSNLETIKGGQKINNIGTKAFYYCSHLKEINMPATLTSIAQQAFANDSSLTAISLPDAIRTIGKKAFSKSGIKELNLGIFGDFRNDIIDGCYNIKAIYVSNNNDKYSCKEGVLFSKDQKQILSYPAAKDNTNYDIDNGVEEIADSAFWGARKLVTLTISESVSTIGKNAFGNSGISEVKILPSIPPKVRENTLGLDQSAVCLYVSEKDYSTYYIANYWGDFKNLYVFNSSISTDDIIHVEIAGTLPSYIGFGNKYNCKSLRISGYLNGDDIRYIREMAGRNIHGEETNGVLSDLDISKASIVAGGGVYYRMSDITSGYKTSDNIIGEEMFKGCHLTNFAISETATKMEKDALTGCTLTTFNVPASLQEIDLSSFIGMNTLQEITVDNNNNNYQAKDNVLFSKDGKYLLLYPYGKKGNIFVVPENVTRINERAFGGSNLQEVYTNEGLDIIDHWAFDNLISLEKITLPSTLRNIGHRAFWGCNKLMMISCKAKNPPSLSYNSYSYSGQPYNNFSDNTYENATLFVPKNSSSYKSQAGWKLFKNIIEVDNWSNGIKTINNSNEVIKRYDINGRDVKSSYRGISIIKMSDGTTKKVIIK